MTPRSLVVALCLAVWALGVPSMAWAADGFWDEVAHPNRRACAKLLDDAGKLRGNGEAKPAIAAAQKAADLCRADRDVQQTAGELLLGLREYADGRARLERARQLADTAAAGAGPPTASRDRDLALAFHLGFAREVTGDLAGAIEEHRRLEAMGGMPSPNQYLVHYNLGDELMACGRLTEAIDEYRRAVSLAPDRPVVRLALAVALDRDERYDKAHAEVAIVLSQDPQLKRLASEEYVFVPPADAHYYRAIALVERGLTGEARLALRSYLVEAADGPYSKHARRRLDEIERQLDGRELEPATTATDRRAVARVLAPLAASMEDCLPAGRIVRIRVVSTGGAVRTEMGHPAAECLDRVLSHVDRADLRLFSAGPVTVPLAGRRAAASLP